MRRFLKNTLYRNIPMSEYKCTTSESQPEEKVYLISSDHRIDVSESHWPLSLQPLIFGAWLHDDYNIDVSRKISFQFVSINSSKPFATATAELFETLLVGRGRLLLFQITAVHLGHVSRLELGVLFRCYFKKPQLGFDRFALNSLAFSYPRKVRLVSFRDDDFCSIFPMDLLGIFNQENDFVFGLRHSNRALERILKRQKLVVAEVGPAHQDDIYALGAFHSTAMPPLDTLPLDIISTVLFSFPVPAYTEAYHEIEITGHRNVGSHMLLIGRSCAQTRLRPATGSLCHIHFLLALARHRMNRSASMPLKGQHPLPG